MTPLRTEDLVPLYRLLQAPDGEPLMVGTEDGRPVRLNDPAFFAVTPELLAAKDVEVSVTIIDRTYRVIGMTAMHEFVLARVDSAEDAGG